ncbi:MAG: class I SAM-dependent methyltransferase [Alphaproteobacteria bacterium]
MTRDEDGYRVLHYDASRAAAWNKWFHIMEDGAQPLSDRMVGLANIGPGSSVLDIATGLGEPALTAARLAGPSGHVLATDLSLEMLAFARERASAAGLSNIEFRQMDANRLDVVESSFDAVLSRWGLMFLAHLDDTLAAVGNCLKPHGRFAAAVWGAPEDAPSVSLSNRVVLKALGLAPPDEGAMTPFALQDTDGLIQRVRKAGFREVQSEWFDVNYVFPTPKIFAEFRRDRAGELKDRISHMPASSQDAAWAAVAEAAKDYIAPDGVVRMRNRAFCLVALR